MRDTNYLIMYAISNTMYIFTIHKFMCVFFENIKIKEKFLFCAYALAYIVNTVTFILDGRPIVNFIINITILGLLTLIYETSFRKRGLAVIFVYFFLMVVESLIAFLFLKIEPSLHALNGGSILALAISRIISYGAVMFFQSFRFTKADIQIEKSSLIFVMIIPLLSVYSLLKIYGSPLYEPNEIVQISIVFLVINFVVLYLFDRINMAFSQKIIDEIDMQQIKAAASQLEVMHNTQIQIREIKHDLSNHIIAIQEFLRNGKTHETMLYLEDTFQILKGSQNSMQTGNLAIDSILNYKINIALRLSIDVKTKIIINSRLKISDFDLITVIGNLLDNAIEAVSKIEQKTNRHIKLLIFFEKNILRIKCENRCLPNQIHLKDLTTTKTDRGCHGIGLKRVKKAVEKNNGHIHIEVVEDYFITDLIMLNS